MMTDVLRFGFLSVLLVIAVEANLEYTARVARTLLNFESLKDTGASLVHSLIDPATSSVAFRIESPSEKGIHFYVQTHELVHGSGEFHIPLPGIRTALKKCLNPCGLYCCSKPEENPLQDFFFHEMHFDIARNYEQEPYMNLDVIFYDKVNDQNIEIHMNLFKPPNYQFDKEYADEHKVPTVESPIPLTELTDISLQNEYMEKYGKLLFIVNISWMENILKSAKFDGRKDLVGKPYTEVYEAGPVIINPLAYDLILNLEPEYKQYADTNPPDLKQI